MLLGNFVEVNAAALLGKNDQPERVGICVSETTCASEPAGTVTR